MPFVIILRGVLDMKKKGFLILDEWISIVIAVIGLVLIVGLFVGFYRASSQGEERQAREFLDKLEGKIDVLENGQKNEFLLQTVKKWTLIGWEVENKGRTIKSDPDRPGKCSLKSCICLCPSLNDFSGSTDYWDNEVYLSKYAASCNSEGICRKFDNVGIDIKSNVRFEGFKIGSGILDGGSVGDIYSAQIRRIDFIKEELNLMNFEISKDDQGGISIESSVSLLYEAEVED
jgi:hypothetical protein